MLNDNFDYASRSFAAATARSFVKIIQLAISSDFREVLHMGQICSLFLRGPKNCDSLKDGRNFWMT